MVFVPADSGFFATLDRRYHVVHILAAALLAAATIAAFLLFFAPRAAWGPSSVDLAMKGTVADKIDLILATTGPNQAITMTENTTYEVATPFVIATLNEKSNRSFKVDVTSANLLANTCGVTTKPCLLVTGGEAEDILLYDLVKGVTEVTPWSTGVARWSTSAKNKTGTTYNVGMAYGTGPIFRTQGDYVDTLTFVISAN